MWLIVIVLLAAPAFACNKGCTPYEDGVCVCDPPQEIYKMAPTPTSDEKPPTDKMPSYQRAGIHADMPVSLAAHDERALVVDTAPMVPNDGVPVRSK